MLNDAATCQALNLVCRCVAWVTVDGPVAIQLGVHARFGIGASAGHDVRVQSARCMPYWTHFVSALIAFAVEKPFKPRQRAE
eukprot:6805111-Alexandrium_andersonii.AAC.1